MDNLKPAFFCQGLTGYHSRGDIAPGYVYRNAFTYGIHDPGHRPVVKARSKYEGLDPLITHQIRTYLDRLIKVA